MDRIWFPDSVAFSPAYILKVFRIFINKYGTKIVLNHRLFQKAREMWVCAVFSLALTKATGKRFWLSAVNNDTTPDVYAFSWQPHPKIKDANIADRVSIEVTEWDSHSPDDLVGSVLRKKIAKAYPEYYNVLVYVKRYSQKTNLEDIFQQLKKLPIKVSEINLLSSVVGLQKDNHMAVCLYPKRFAVNFSLKEEEDKDTTTQVRRMSYGNNSSKPTLEPFILKLPDINELI